MKTYANLFNKLFRTPVMLHSPVREHLEMELIARMGMEPARLLNPDAMQQVRQGQPMEETLQYYRNQAATRKQWRVEKIYQAIGNTAVISIAGVIDKHLSEFEMECYGGCDLADVDHALQAAESDPKIERIILAINSPGGSVLGVPETAERVARLRANHEVHAWCDGMMCSAAYYIGSQADHITATPSAIIGSIGVYIAILDETKRLEMEGLKVELFKAGRMKAMGASFKELSDEEREFLQTSVDNLHGEFRAAVTSLRKVDEDTMQGQWWAAKDAAKLNLVDGLTTQNLDEFLSSL